MTKSDRDEIKSAIKRRGKIERQKAEAYGKRLIANADAEMERQFTTEDLGIQHVLDQATAEVDKVRARMRAQFDAMGVAEDLRSDFQLVNWRGGYRDESHRSELRRKARVEVDAAIKRRLAEIEAWEDQALTDLALTGLTSDAARLMLEALPAVDEALPAVADILGPVEEQPLAFIDSSREAKRHTVLRALDASPQASNREIGRLLGVDHKTVGKIRAERGELPTSDGELPASSGEFPKQDESAEVDP